MVKDSRLDLDESLLESEAKWSPLGGGRTDNAIAIIAVVAVALIVLLAITAKNENWWAVFLIGLLFFASEFFALPMKSGGRLSIALMPLVIAMMVSGPLGTALVPLFAIPVFFMERGEQGIRRIVNNTCQFLVAAGAAGWIFWHTGGNLLKPDISNGGKLLLPWIIATVVFFVLNTVLTALVLTPEDDRLLRFWRLRLLHRLPGYVLYSGIGFLAAIVYLKLEFPGVVLLFAPLLGIRVVYTRYAKMRDVCDDTTLSIMEAVEGGGMFSEGHSLGVADVVEAIAEEMNFQEEDLHYLRQAALLHDVGKLALDPGLIDKPDVLTPEEFEEIKKHPLISSEIISKQASFAAVAPSVTHHHESVDGGGYVDGLAGDTIPLGARILAVADAFDAMQRSTAYREPMDPFRAASEIVRGKGVQYDPEVADAFIKVMKKRGIWAGPLGEKVSMHGRESGGEQPQVSEADQPSLDDAAAGVTEAGATPVEGKVYEEMKGEIEQDIREWKKADGGRRRRVRAEQKRRTPSLWKKKGKEGEGPES
jgi:putative nucleotidyltransferase with HDIG domain